MLHLFQLQYISAQCSGAGQTFRNDKQVHFPSDNPNDGLELSLSKIGLSPMINAKGTLVNKTKLK